jgi:hypothetical protein
VHRLAHDICVMRQDDAAHEIGRCVRTYVLTVYCVGCLCVHACLHTCVPFVGTARWIKTKPFNSFSKCIYRLIAKLLSNLLRRSWYETRCEVFTRREGGSRSPQACAVSIALHFAHRTDAVRNMKTFRWTECSKPLTRTSRDMCQR